MSALSQCPGCSRHVKVTETACPFCGIAVSLLDRVAPEATSSGKRLGRAALLAIGAATAIACETPKAEPNGPAAVYGGPPVEARDAGTPVPVPVPSASVDTDRTIYGGPPVVRDQTTPVPKPSATEPPRTIYGGPPTKK